MTSKEDLEVPMNDRYSYGTIDADFALPGDVVGEVYCDVYDDGRWKSLYRGSDYDEMLVIAHRHASVSRPVYTTVEL